MGLIRIIKNKLNKRKQKYIYIPSSWRLNLSLIEHIEKYNKISVLVAVERYTYNAPKKMLEPLVKTILSIKEFEEWKRNRVLPILKMSEEAYKCYLAWCCNLQLQKKINAIRTAQEKYYIILDWPL